MSETRKLANQDKDFFINYESCHETSTWLEIKPIFDGKTGDDTSTSQKGCIFLMP